MSFLSLEPLINKTISPHDHLYKVYEKNYTPNEYFLSGIRQLETLDAILNEHAHEGLKDCKSIADFACHYGRLLRCLRAALPDAELSACDIDRDAIDFCASQFGCRPFRTGWYPWSLRAIGQHDLVVCISLLTHTHKNFLRRVLGLWERMLKPGGVLVFSFLGERYIDEWIAGKMEHYGPVSMAIRDKKVREFHKNGHTFCGYSTSYSFTKKKYGIGFLSQTVVENEISGFRRLRYLETIPGFENSFGQDIAVVRKLPV